MSITTWSLRGSSAGFAFPALASLECDYTGA